MFEAVSRIRLVAATTTIIRIVKTAADRIAEIIMLLQISLPGITIFITIQPPLIRPQIAAKTLVRIVALQPITLLPMPIALRALATITAIAAVVAPTDAAAPRVELAVRLCGSRLTMSK
ncbi:hypothetical protein ACOME3_001088 [Neoechinorhynchus agilis]